MLLPSGIEEGLFKRVANGWLFSAPHPWAFAPRRSFLVDDARKTLLAAQVRRGRYYRLLAMIPMFGLPFATLLLAPSLVLTPSVATWLLCALFIVVATFAINLCDYLPVRSLLVGVPRTTERIGLIEMHDKQAQAMSVKALATLAGIEVLAFVIVLVEWFMSGRTNGYKLVTAAGLGFLAALFLVMLFAKLRVQRSAA